MLTRRRFHAHLAGLAALAVTGLPTLTHAQGKPPEMARLFVGFPPGGSTDIVARRLAEKLRGSYANTVLVENRPGAGTQIAVSAVKDSPADGSVLLLSPPAPFSLYPHTYRSLPYAPEDLTPVAMVNTFDFAFAVGPAVPESVKTLDDFMAWAKANPGQAHFGSPAAGSGPHLVGSLLAKMRDVDLTHVAYRGDAPGLQDLMGGQIAAYSTTLGSYLPHLSSGRLRLIGISGAERSRFVPELATFREQGFPLDITEWFGVFVPARTPPETIARLSQAVQDAVNAPDFANGLAEFGMTATTSTPAQLAERLREDSAQWGTYVQQIGFTADP